MAKQHKPTLLRIAASPPAAAAESGFVARFHAALAGWKAFFTRGATPAEAEVRPVSRNIPAANSAGGDRVTQRKHLRVVHTGTRI